MLSFSVMSHSLWSHGLQPSMLQYAWVFSRQEYWSGCHALIQGIFPTQGSNPGLTRCRWILYWPSHQGIPIFFYLSWKCYCYYKLIDVCIFYPFFFLYFYIKWKCFKMTLVRKFIKHPIKSPYAYINNLSVFECHILRPCLLTWWNNIHYLIICAYITWFPSVLSFVQKIIFKMGNILMILHCTCTLSFSKKKKRQPHL